MSLKTLFYRDMWWNKSMEKLRLHLFCPVTPVVKFDDILTIVKFDDILTVVKVKNNKNVLDIYPTILFCFSWQLEMNMVLMSNDQDIQLLSGKTWSLKTFLPEDMRWRKPMNNLWLNLLCLVTPNIKFEGILAIVKVQKDNNKLKCFETCLDVQKHV